MPLTPATWLDDFVVNLTTTGTQSTPRITQLTNGNILVVWDSTDNSGAGSPDGVDVIGQLFNPLGERVGTEFLVNSNFFLDDEGDADIAALPGGGFLTVFEGFDGATNSIRLIQRDASGGNPVGISIADDTSSNADPSFLDPRVAVSSGTSALVTYTENEAGGDSRIVGRIYDPTTNTLGSEISLINFAGTNTDAEVAVLTNGNYVIAVSTVETNGNSTISYRIISTSGSNVMPVTRVPDTTGDTTGESDPSITALTGGGFVMSWSAFSSSGDLETLEVQIFSAAGVALAPAFSVASQDPFGLDPFEPSLVRLSDGGFLVLFDKEETTSLQGRRYDASGAQVGDTFFLSFGDFAGDIDAVVLADGRVAVSFQDEDGEMRMEILDTRDDANDPGVYTPQDWQIGTIGDDTITSDGDVFFVAGHDGDDTINTGGPAATYLGGNGDDRINVIGSFDADSWDGGSGSDTVDFSASFSGGGTFNLEAGTAVIDGNTRSMTGFENLVGTDGDDTITGTTGINNLDGGGGGDTITGGDGADVLIGGNGDDTITDSSNGTSNGGAGNDTLINTFVDGGTWNGGADIDTLDTSADNFSNETYNLAAASFAIFSTTFSNFENVTDNNGSNTLIGSTGANVLRGNGGNDTIRGGGSADTLDGGNGRDTLDGGMGNDKLKGGAGADSFAFSTKLSPANIDLIQAFNVAADTIRLDNAVFASLATGKLLNGAFAANAQGSAADRGDRIIYDNNSGELYYDSDGNGAGLRVHFATLTPGLALTAADFFVF